MGKIIQLYSLQGSLVKSTELFPYIIYNKGVVFCLLDMPLGSCYNEENMSERIKSAVELLPHSA